MSGAAAASAFIIAKGLNKNVPIEVGVGSLVVLIVIFSIAMWLDKKVK